MKRLFTILGAMVFMAGSAACAQEVSSNVPPQTAVTEVVASNATNTVTTDDDVDLIPSISLDSRFGYEHTFSGKAAGFGGDGFYLNIDGSISKNFSYSLSQRLFSSSGEDDSVFDYTDWLTLTYNVGRFSFTAGKDVVKVGSFEYDAYDLDSYYDMNSAFYNEFDCWQWGVSAAWYPAEDHEFLLQVARSPLSDENVSIAAGWRGSWEGFESYWTANLWGKDRGMIPAVALGNRFTFGNLTVDLDLSARFGDTYLSGAAAILAPSYQIGEWGRAFTKIGIDRDNTFFGCGFEYFPLKENKSIRLHAAYTCNDYTVGNMINIGLTWKLNVTQTIKNIFTKLN
jgi:hypothetical protein